MHTVFYFCNKVGIMNPSHHSLEALDLHLIKQNTPTPAQSTWLASQLSKKTGSRSVLALVDTPSGCVIPHPHFLKGADKKILLTSNEIKPIYSDIISKLFREQDRDAIFESLSSEYSCIDAVMNKRHAKHHEMIFRIGFQSIFERMDACVIKECSI